MTISGALTWPEDASLSRGWLSSPKPPPDHPQWLERARGLERMSGEPVSALRPPPDSCYLGSQLRIQTPMTTIFIKEIYKGENNIQGPNKTVFYLFENTPLTAVTVATVFI